MKNIAVISFIFLMIASSLRAADPPAFLKNVDSQAMSQVIEALQQERASGTASMATISSLLALTASHRNQVELASAAKDYALHYAQTFQGGIPQGDVEILIRQCVANQLGISPAILKRWPDFQQFIMANGIERTLARYGDSVSIGRYGIPTLTVKGKPASWTLFKEKKPIDPRTGKLQGMAYTEKGFETLPQPSQEEPRVVQVVVEPNPSLPSVQVVVETPPFSSLALTEQSPPEELPVPPIQDKIVKAANHNTQADEPQKPLSDPPQPPEPAGAENTDEQPEQKIAEEVNAGQPENQNTGTEIPDPQGFLPTDQEESTTPETLENHNPSTQEPEISLDEITAKKAQAKRELEDFLKAATYSLSQLPDSSLKEQLRTILQKMQDNLDKGVDPEQIRRENEAIFQS